MFLAKHADTRASASGSTSGSMGSLTTSGRTWGFAVRMHLVTAGAAFPKALDASPGAVLALDVSPAHPLFIFLDTRGAEEWTG